MLKKTGSLLFFVLLISISTVWGQSTSKNTLPDGKKLYLQICLGCHQEDGGGVPGMNPPLSQTSYVLGDKTELIKIILKGLSGKVKIEGKYYSNIMASQAYLKDDQIAAILTYVRSHFGNNASEVKASEVKNTREHL